jgi:hypothetical protein
MIQVFANAGDATDPGVDGVFGTSDDVDRGTAGNPIGERLIELWAAVDPPGADLGDIQQVYWDIYHPDGTKKAQVHDRYGYGAELCRQGYGNFLGAGEAVPFDPTSFGISSPNTVMGAAFGTEQVSEEAVESIITSCAQQQKKLYQSHFTLSKHQPCGEYRVVAHAVPVIGPEDTLENFFDVLCFIHLDLDYTECRVDDANTTGWAFYEGDFDMETPGLPTAINAGSGNLTVVVEFFPMESYQDLNGNPLSGKWIEEFDVSFGVSESSLTALTDAAGSEVIVTDQNNPTVGVSTVPNFSAGTTLCTNEPGKFIYSLHTNGALPGRYAGELKVSAVPSDPYVCHNTTAPGIWGGYRTSAPTGSPTAAVRTVRRSLRVASTTTTAATSAVRRSTSSNRSPGGHPTARWHEPTRGGTPVPPLVACPAREAGGRSPLPRPRGGRVLPPAGGETRVPGRGRRAVSSPSGGGAEGAARRRWGSTPGGWSVPPPPAAGRPGTPPCGGRDTVGEHPGRVARPPPSPGRGGGRVLPPAGGETRVAKAGGRPPGRSVFPPPQGEVPRRSRRRWGSPPGGWPPSRLLPGGETPGGEAQRTCRTRSPSWVP